MRLSVATNFDDELVEQLRGLPVHDLFGKLAVDEVGGGRSSYLLQSVSRRRLARHINAAHAAGFGFNYLLNAACLDNRESTRRGHRAIRRLLDGLCRLGIDSVTVAVPSLLKLIKRSYPTLRVRISVFAQIDTVSKARWWANEGADALTLDSLGVNREFATLRAIRQAVPIDLQLLANNHCVSRCPMAGYHMNVLAHSSQANHPSGGFVLDHCLLTCTTQRVRDSVEYLRGDWIRPEDLHHYEALGYDWFKIVERNAPTPVLVKRVRAYASRRYDGNLLDLIQPFGYPQPSSPRRHINRGLFWSWRMLMGLSSLRPSFLRCVRRLARRRGWLQELPSAPVMIHNHCLDGFIDRFLTQGCRDLDCESCRYCHRWAAKVVDMDPTFRRQCLDDTETVLAQLESGRCWR